MKVIIPKTVTRSPVTLTRSSIASVRDEFGDFKIVASNTIRYNYFRTTPTTGDFTNNFDRILIEPTKTNYLKNTASNLTPGSGVPINLVNQSVSLGTINSTNGYLTLSFFGTGTVTVTGGGFTYSLTGTAGLHSALPSYITFPTRASTLTITVTGTVYAANLENVKTSYLGGTSGGQTPITDPVICTALTRPTSWIPTTTVAATRQQDIVSNKGILVSSFTDSTATWSSATTYAALTQVRYQDKIYISIIDGNLNNNPTTSPNWLFVSSSNDFALLDLETGSTSKAVNGSLGVFFCYVLNEPDTFLFDNFFKSVGLTGVDAKQIDLNMQMVTDIGTFTKTVNLQNTSAAVVDGLYDELYEPSVIANNYFRDFSTSYIVVSFRIHNGFRPFDNEMLEPTSEVSVNELVIGDSQYLGKLQYGMQSSIIDYSRKETNEFGTTVFVKRGFSKRLSCELYLDNSEYNTLAETLFTLRASPTVWIATEDENFASTAIIFGSYKDFSLRIAYPENSLCSLEIEGLVL
jgi:hypothetical protein